jgi:hypothetical protein
MNPNNVSIKEFDRFLVAHGCKQIRHHKGHFVYAHKDATRPIIFQDHIEPVPLFIIQNNLRNIGLTLKAIREFS